MTNSTSTHAATDVMESPLHHHVAHTNADRCGRGDERRQVSRSPQLTRQPTRCRLYGSSGVCVECMALPTAPNTSARAKATQWPIGSALMNGCLLWPVARKAR